MGSLCKSLLCKSLLCKSPHSLFSQLSRLLSTRLCLGHGGPKRKEPGVAPLLRQSLVERLSSKVKRYQCVVVHDDRLAANFHTLAVSSASAERVPAGVAPLLVPGIMAE